MAVFRDFMTAGLQENRAGMTALARSSTKVDSPARKDRKTGEECAPFVRVARHDAQKTGRTCRDRRYRSLRGLRTDLDLPRLHRRRLCAVRSGVSGPAGDRT